MADATANSGQCNPPPTPAPSPPPATQCSGAAAPAPGSRTTPATKVEAVIPPPGMLRKLLPIAAFFMAFATVMTLLLVYMDTTAMRHHQFKINMTQDYNLLNVAQDDPQLITYIREVHVRPAVDPHHYHVFNSSFYMEPTEKTLYVTKILNNKRGGVFVEASAYRHNRPSDTEWLERNLSWSGLLVQPDPRDYFNLRKHGRGRSQSIHACLSPTCYPKEVTFHQDERDGVKINSVHANSLIDDDWFNTRVKCFPLYSLLLAINCTTVDYLILDTDGTELQVLATMPFERVRIEILDVHLPTDDKDLIDTLKKTLAMKNYKFVQNFKLNYIFLLNHVKI
ncbi:Star [Carabus blaptoides fortunei]